MMVLKSFQSSDSSRSVTWQWGGCTVASLRLLSSSRSLGGGRGVRGLATLFAVSLALAPAAATAAPAASAVRHAAGRALHAGAFRAGDLDGLHAAVGLALLDDVFHGLVLLRDWERALVSEAQLITVISRTAGSWKSK